MDKDQTILIDYLNVCIEKDDLNVEILETVKEKSRDATLTSLLIILEV